MFFSKTATSNLPSLQIVIIGTSSQAFFLSDIFQTKNCHVSILVSTNQLQTMTKSNSLLIRTSGFQNKRAEFSFTDNLVNQPDFCFLASAPEKAKTDILFLQNPFLKNTPIINLSSFYNRNIIKQLSDTNEIPAFLSTLLLKEKGILQVLSRNSKLEICSTSEELNILKKYLNSSTVSTTFSEKSPDIFWQNFATFFIGNLLSLSSDQNINETLAVSRKQIETAIQELSIFAIKDNTTLNSTEVLASLYTINDTYQSDIVNSKQFNAFANILPEINYFETPTLFDFLTKASKKYSV